jgi:glycosyltransferase involved in cell wall biosynthesis
MAVEGWLRMMPMQPGRSTSSVDAAIERLHRHNPWFRREAGEPQGSGVGVRGVRVTGYFSDESGWGAAGRGYLRALQRLQTPLKVHDVSALTTNRSQDRSLRVADTAVETNVNLVCVDAGQHFALLSEVGESFFTGHYNIGAWAWELPRFPDGWYDRFAYYDEIWVGTSFIAAALAPIAPVPVIRVPPVVDAACGSRSRGRHRLGIAGDEFVFAFIFDVHSHLPRKNPHAVITAFRKAFPRPRNVRLVLKSVNAAADPQGFAELRTLAGDAPIDFHDGYWPAGHVHDLLAACDAYVSLHRSEGTGLTIAEAMAGGKPVIATDWSGNTDFADASNSFPVAYELTTVARSVGPYRAGETWAEPDVEHAAALMQQVVSDPADAARRGAAARQRMLRDYSPDPVAGVVGARLDVIGSRDRLADLRREVSAFVGGYRGLVDDIREIVAKVLPPREIVAVVSRGDGELLKLEQGAAWHFPEARPGVYAGHHPADSDAAIAALESTRRRGARFLLFPGTAFWWLDHYERFRRYLEDEYHCVWRDECCAIYDLRTAVVEASV